MSDNDYQTPDVQTFTTSATVRKQIKVSKRVGFYLQSKITVDVAVTGASVKLAASADGASGTYVDIPESTQAFSASGVFAWDVSDPNYSYIEVVYTLASGTISVVQTFN